MSQQAYKVFDEVFFNQKMPDGEVMAIKGKVIAVLDAGNYYQVIYQIAGKTYLKKCSWSFLSKRPTRPLAE